jgi:hypothetical protein
MTAEAAAPETGSARDKAKILVSVTEYVVLRSNSSPGSEGRWDRVNVITARSADQAVREVVGKLAEADQSGTFVAIPARSFKPVTVRTQTVTTLKLEEAK